MADKNKNEALVKALLNPTAPKIDNSKMANQLKGFPQDMRKWTELQKAQYNAQPSVQKQKYDMQKAGNAGVGEGLLTINSFMPVTGDIQSGVMAANDLKQGNYGSAALNSLGLLPFIPSMAGMIASKGDKVSDAIRPLTEFEQKQLTAQKNAVEMLGLPPNNTAMDRARVLYPLDFNHGTQRLDRLLEGKGLNPKRATSGPMPYGTPSTQLASNYSLNKADTSRIDSDVGDMSNYFQVSPKQLGYRGTAPYSVEQSWHHLTPEQKLTISQNSKRLGYEDPEQQMGNFVLHNDSSGMPFSESHYDWTLKNDSRNNPLTALRKLYGESGYLDAYDQSQLADIYKIVGYPHEISQANAPWTTANGVLTGRANISNPLDTSDVNTLKELVIPKLKEAFKNDRTRLKSGSDMWAKNSRYTPKDWVKSLEDDIASGGSSGSSSSVFTSIPDKVTEQLKSLGFNGIIDKSNKSGASNLGTSDVIIPFYPNQVRSKFAAFDPARTHEADLLGRATPEMLGLLAVGSGAGVGYAYNKKEKKKTK